MRPRSTRLRSVCRADGPALKPEGSSEIEPLDRFHGKARVRLSKRVVTSFLAMWLGGPSGLLWLIALQAAPLPVVLGPLIKLGQPASMLLGLWLLSWPAWAVLFVMRREWRPMCLSAVAGGLLSLWTSLAPVQQRKAWLAEIAVQGDLLATRLEEQRAKKGAYPAQIGEAELATGAAGYSVFTYEPDSEHGYELSLSTSSGGINFDRMFYWPSRTYPSSLHGEPLEKIGNWAYLHE